MTDREESEHFDAVVAAFVGFADKCRAWAAACEASFAQLPAAQQAKVPQYGARMAVVRRAIDANERFVALIVAQHRAMFEGGDDGSGGCGMLSEENRKLAASDFFAEKTRSTLAQFARDWSDDGAEERRACYGPLLAVLEARWPDIAARRLVRVLGPGAGLGRLTYEVAARGFVSEGNEFSYFMLLASNFVLNVADRVRGYVVHPFVRHATNVVRGDDQVRAVLVPDVLASASPVPLEMSMTAGDFLEVYTAEEHAAAWDAVLTSFFIDTAHNVIDYIEAIAYVLKPGGIWANLGPLLWHFAEMPGEFSIELTWEEVRSAILSSGFTISQESGGGGESYRDCPYANNSRSLLNVSYKAIFFVAIRDNSKPIRPSPLPLPVKKATSKKQHHQHRQQP
jgi:carnosine N-methyltransferase